MEKWQTIFKAGNYDPQGRFTEQDISDIAAAYDPVNTHEAPLWVGHPNMFSAEPKALAWVSALRAVGDELQALFTDVTEELKHLVSSKTFKRCSVELHKFKNAEGIEKWYLVAVGLTNRPAASIPALEFTGRNYNQSFLTSRTTFTNENVLLFHKPHNNTMFQKLIQTAAKFGLDVSGITEANAESLFASLDAKFTEVSSTVAALKTENETLKASVAQFSQQRVEDLLSSAIADGKILPADKDKYSAFAKDNFDAAKAMFSAMPVNPAFQRDVTGSPAARGDDSKTNKTKKFTNPDGSPLTYSQFLDNSLKDVDYLKNFTNEEVDELKAKYPLKH